MNERVPSFPWKLFGRRAVVTGASRVIGAAIALGLAEAGADVFIHHWNDEPAAEALAETVRGLGRAARCVSADLSVPVAAGQIHAAVTASFPAVDILVSNVAIQHPEPWHEVQAEHFQEQVQINWQAGFELIQLFAPAMLKNHWGRILTIGSVQESRPHPHMVVYASLKAAQTHMIVNLAKQFAPHGVTINNLAPGVIDTDRSRQRLTDPEYRRAVLSSIPKGRIGSPQDCVGAALLFCSDAGRYITGQTLYVDGGMAV